MQFLLVFSRIGPRVYVFSSAKKCEEVAPVAQR